jgi:hypothetical protein
MESAMSLIGYVRQVRPIQESHVNHLDKVQSLFSEAYDIIPKSSGEIDTLDIPHDKESLKGLFDELSTAGMADPIALQASTPKNVKVSRSISDNFNLSALSKKYGFKVTEGEGSRGGRGSKSTGFAFEGEVTKDIETYIEEGETSENFKYPDFMKELHKDVLSKHENIQVSLEGGANTRRPLEFTDIGALIGGRELNIGNKVTDVTVLGDGKPYYLSLKFGGTVTFFNAGVGRIFTADQFENGKITNKDAKRILDIFGIDEKQFIEIFTKYKKGAKKSTKQRVNATRKTNMRALLQLLVTGIGHGYYMVHRKGKKVEFYEMSKRRMMDSAKVKSVTILYPKPGSAKRLDIEVVTKLYIFKINIRNKQGGLYPSHIMCDYVPNPDFKP